jgi:uncharacterized protein (DUF983 family)
MTNRRPAMGTLLKRGLGKRCPLCGRGRVFQSFFTMRDRCPHCNYSFEREEGYWVGAVIMNFVFVETWFAILFVTVVFATLPDIAWMPLLAVAIVTNGILPVILYPHSKTIWMAVDVYFHPPKVWDLRSTE